MNQHIEWRLPRSPRSAGRARAFLVGQAREWKLPDDTTETAVLLLSELVTNACRHARVSPGREVWTRCVLRDGVLRIEVSDASDVLPCPRSAAPDDESGRGLALVEALADAWGAYPRECGIGKTVWFEVGAGVTGDGVRVHRGCAALEGVDGVDEPRGGAMTHTTKPTRESRHLEGMRGRRYGEVLLISPTEDGGLKGAVYNTFGLNDCPLDKWNALDGVALAERFQVPMVFLNGPRFWTIDEVTTYAWGDVEKFDGLEARWAADVRIPTDIDVSGATPRKFYVDTTVERDTEYVLDAGKPVYALVGPGGRTYILQAYSHTVDDSQTIDSLSTLGERLELPQGWRFRVHTPDEDMHVRTADNKATVLQDELENTYMLHIP
ncbi:ATP-binding protein [Streptomyces sp. NPDC059881]|uniref:ATP-binding protein n=1 Tax=Streptomyces sp. NPDC059881 TaxID=3346986 RepID=UPI003667D7E9